MEVYASWSWLLSPVRGGRHSPARGNAYSLRGQECDSLCGASHLTPSTGTVSMPAVRTELLEIAAAGEPSRPICAASARPASPALPPVPWTAAESCRGTTEDLVGQRRIIYQSGQHHSPHHPRQRRDRLLTPLALRP